MPNPHAPRPTSLLHAALRRSLCTTVFCRFTFAPLVIASDLAGVSTMGDDLVEGLSAKCVEDFANQKIVTPLIETLLTLNQGQGLGVSGFILGKLNCEHRCDAIGPSSPLWWCSLTPHTLYCSFKSSG